MPTVTIRRFSEMHYTFMTNPFLVFMSGSLQRIKKDKINVVLNFICSKIVQDPKTNSRFSYRWSSLQESQKDEHFSEPSQKGREYNSQRIQNTSSLRRSTTYQVSRKKWMKVNFLFLCRFLPRRAIREAVGISQKERSIRAEQDCAVLYIWPMSHSTWEEAGKGMGAVII